MRLNLYTKTGACLLGASMLVAGGCAEEAGPTSDRGFDGPGIELSVAALTAAGYGDGCYAFTVTNGEGATVVSESNICGSSYGFDAEISYIAPCDASSNPHSVEIIVEALCDGDTCGTYGANEEGVIGWSGAATDYVNPCAAGDDNCINADVVCTANEDTFVEFNIVTMRQAEQGFFDIAVNFNDIFCSAKLDCVGDLLHNGETRDQTAVVGFACTSGAGANNTQLMMTDVVINCIDDVGNAGGFEAFSPDVDGNAALLVGGATSPLFGASVSRGAQANNDLLYWNLMVGYNDIGACWLNLEATALDATDANALLAIPATPTGTTYPVLVWNIQLTDDTGASVCGATPVDFTVEAPNDYDTSTTFLGARYEEASYNASGGWYGYTGN